MDVWKDFMSFTYLSMIPAHGRIGIFWSVHVWVRHPVEHLKAFGVPHDDLIKKHSEVVIFTDSQGWSLSQTVEGDCPQDPSTIIISTYSHRWLFSQTVEDDHFHLQSQMIILTNSRRWSFSQTVKGDYMQIKNRVRNHWKPEIIVPSPANRVIILA